MERVRMPEKPVEINGENYDVILKRLAHKSGLTQMDLCASAGVNIYTFHNWMSREYCPRLTGLCRMLDVMGYKLMVTKKEAGKRGKAK